MMTDSYSFINGLLLGILLLLMFFSMLIGWAYKEPALGVVSAAAALGMADLSLRWPQLHAVAVPLAMSVLLLSLGKSGALRMPHRLLSVICMGTIALLVLRAIVPLQREAQFALQGIVGVAWSVAAAWLLQRAWTRSMPWIFWLALGQVLLFAGFALHDVALQALPLALWLKWPVWQVQQIWTVFHIALFCVASYLGLVWRSRVLSEAQLRSTEYATRDPLTGCMTAKQFRRVLTQCAYRSLNLQYKSGVILVHCANLPEFAREIDPDSHESGVLIVSQLVRKILRGHDAVVRLQGGMFGLLIDGLIHPQHMTQLSTKLVAAGLRHTLPNGQGFSLEFKLMTAPLLSDAEQSTAWFTALEQQFLSTLRLGQKRSIFELTDTQSAELLSPS